MSTTRGLKPPPTDDLGLPVVVPDPKLQAQMVTKLIDVEIDHVEALIKIKKQVLREAQQALAKSSPRCYTDCSRGRDHAIDRFLRLKEKGL